MTFQVKRHLIAPSLVACLLALVVSWIVAQLMDMATPRIFYYLYNAHDTPGWVRDDAFVMLLGPSTPLTPALHRFGIDVLCGTLVDEPESVTRAIEQGAVTSQITGVRRVCLWK